MRKKSSALFVLSMLAMCLTTSGCVVIESSAISDRTATGQVVNASVSDFGILRLTVPQNLTGAANSQLVTACPSGKLSNVQTELSMRDFLIVQLYRITADATCQ
jgi:hypothetical protein